jgi:hypothetical protein
MAWSMVHALSIEVIGAVDFPNKNPDGTLNLMRTDADYVLAMHGITTTNTPEQNAQRMRRTALDCCTYSDSVIEYGNQVTLYTNVPPHLVAGGNFTRLDGTDRMQTTMVVDLDGLPFYYLGTATTPDKLPSGATLAMVDKNDTRFAPNSVMRNVFGLDRYVDSNGKIFYCKPTKSK